MRADLVPAIARLLLAGLALPLLGCQPGQKGVPTLQDDEVPIYVKNGSMKVTTASSWEAQGNGAAAFYAHAEGRRPSSSDLFYVRVTLGKSGRCEPAATANEYQGTSVTIDYSVPSVHARFHRYGPAGRRRTKLTPAHPFEQTSAQELSSKEKGGYITVVSISGDGTSDGVCTFEAPAGDDDKIEIAICTKERTECKTP